MALAERTVAADYAALSDAELVALVKERVAAAFQVIVRRCNQRLYRVARSIVGDDAEAEDVVQEAYTRAYANLDSFRGDALLSTWLTRIAINEAYGRVRRRHVSVGLDCVDRELSDHAETFPFVDAANPEKAAARTQISQLIETAVDQLPEPLRLVFMLRDIEGCSVAETAAILELREETVRTRLFRARLELRRSLDGDLLSALSGTFPFLGVRCQRITGRVMQALSLPLQA
jgi:RNA polymerase sigma-70 factor (ECF subfamily)